MINSIQSSNGFIPTQPTLSPALAKIALRITTLSPKLAGTVLQAVPKVAAAAKTVSTFSPTLIATQAATLSPKTTGAIVGAATGVIVGVCRKETGSAIYTRAVHYAQVGASVGALVEQNKNRIPLLRSRL